MKSKTKKEAEKEEEDKCNKAVETEDEETEEKVRDKKKAKKEDEDEDEIEKEEDEEDTEKAGASGESPTEANDLATTDAHTTTPKPLIGNAQHVVAGPMTTGIGRNATGTGSPSGTSYTGKSVSPDLLKSPLFVELSGQLNSFEKAFDAKITSMEKQFTDRMDNIKKALSAIEKMSVYKGQATDNENARLVEKSFSEKMNEGKVKFSEA